LSDSPEAKIPLLPSTVPRVLRDHASRISEGILGQRKWDAVLSLILAVLAASHSKLGSIKRAYA